ncbi:MAG: endonuclease MutS2 [Deinococcota bacterium]|nr:endonuclease MutS2 [Deinococcota bacterium]
MKVSETTLNKLDFARVRSALAERAGSRLGVERAEALRPLGDRFAAELAWQRVAEARYGPELALGGVHDIRPLVSRVRDGSMLDGREILEIAYTMDAAGTIKRSILAAERPALSALASRMSSFDGALRLVREQLDTDGNVRDDATPKLRDIRRRLNPLRGRIRERLTELLARYADAVQDPIITLRRDRYVIPIKASSQSKVPGIVLDSSDSGATVFMEPQAVVPMNNELAILELEERDEVRRILIALAQRLAFEPGLEETLMVLGELDLVAASARLARDWELAEPAINDRGRLRLVGARHPLIAGCVPNTFELDEDKRLLIVTGPNMGGKTVSLKTLGLAVIMAHSGLFVAASSETPPTLPECAALLSDIGDEQSIEASLSTYAGHLQNLKAIVEQADPTVLVLIDELGSGTDPAEGAALSQAVLERLLASGARGLITTHLSPLKVFASETPGVVNASMSFDVEALRPRFELVVGQPGRSYALAIAERLGLPADLLGRAAELLGEEGAELESLLVTLEREREALGRERDEAQAARAQAVREAELLRAQIDTLRGREEEVLAAAASRAEEMLQETLERAKQLRRTATSDPEGRSQALGDLMRLRQDVRAKAPKPKPATKAVLGPGTVVRVESYGAQGPITELRGDEVVVQLGLLKVTVPRREVRLVKDPEPAVTSGAYARGGAAQSRSVTFAAPVRFETELNVRGERVEAALERIRDFIQEAHAVKAGPVRILHGKGTGALRDAVRNYLKTERLVERFEDAVPFEGGHGVTVAYLRPS